MAIDPVCGMEVNEAAAQYNLIYKGKMYYFCAPGCLFEFRKNPEKYIESHEHHEHGHGHDHGCYEH
ncbi:MAG: YHS domain-containing protein [Candidatus Asgardarchaeia archaeon]